MAAAVVAAGVSVLVFARIGALHGPTTRLYLATSRARGVIVGTDVWLDGQLVGKVAWVRFRPPTVDPAQRLLIAFDLREDVRPVVRRDTRAQIRSGANYLGAPVIYLSGGTPSAATVLADDTLTTTPQGDLDGVRAQAVLAVQDLPEIRNNIDAVRHQVVSNTGTIGAFSQDEGGRHFDVLSDRAARLSALTARHGGTAGRLATGDLVEQAKRTLAAAHAVREQALSPRSPLGRARDDSLLVRTLGDVRRQLADVQARLAAPLPADSGGDRAGEPGATLAQLRAQLAIADAQLRGLAADMGRRPLRYLVF